MRYEVTLPSLGEDANADATVSAWLVAPGTAVAEGDEILELTTDKAAFTVPSPAAGTLIETRVAEGDEIRVGDPICVLEV